MIQLLILADSLTSKRFTTRTEELTKCYEPLQKLRVRLWPCKTGLSPPVILYNWSFQGDTSVMVFLFYYLVFKTVCDVGALCMFSYF